MEMDLRRDRGVERQRQKNGDWGGGGGREGQGGR